MESPRMRYSLDRTVVINNVREGTNWVIPLFIVLLLLKVFNIVTWSWWIITSQLWGPPAIVIGIIALMLAIVAVIVLVAGVVRVVASLLQLIFK